MDSHRKKSLRTSSQSDIERPNQVRTFRTAVSISSTLGLTSALGLILGMVSIIAAVSGLRDIYALRVAVVALALLGSIAALQTILTARNQPRLRTISILGFPGAGKTVYLSVLYHEMMIHAGQRIKFRPYGAETAERVNEAIHRLSQRQWLPRTATNDVFFHRARASIGSGFFARRYKIEIPDFAGEHVAEFDSSSPRWLHKTEYFRYVLDSDAIILCIDCEAFRAKDEAGLQAQQTSLLAAIQVLMDSKDIEPPHRIEMPVALLFLKSDLLPEMEIGLRDLEDRVLGLVEFLRLHCRHFRTFKVSSVGQATDGLPPQQLRPEGVVEPLIWVLER